MRFGLAIASLVLSGILLLLGIGQRTFLAGPAEIVYGVDAGAKAAYAVIPAAEFDAVAGQPNIVLSGEAAFAATVSDTDAEAWLAPFAHTVLTVDVEGRRLSGTAVAADDSALDEDQLAALAGLDPRGSDLWLAEFDGAGRLPIALEADESVIVAVGSGEQASIAWAQDRRTPWAGPLLIAGGALAVLGLILYLLAVDHDRRGLGPRRGRRGPLVGIRDMIRRPGSRSAKRLAVPAIGLAAVLGLSSCSASYWPEFSSRQTEESPAAEESTAAPVPVTQGQIDRIIAEIVRVADDADEALDAGALAERFTGDALEQRTANYKIRSAVENYEVVPPRITDEQLGYELVQSTEGWPRTVLVTLASASDGADDAPADTAEGAETSAEDAEAGDETPAASPSLALVMTQTEPHQNYLVSRVLSLRGGIAMPEAAPSEEGTALLSDTQQHLLLQPGEVGAAYARALAGDTGSEQAALFDTENDPIIAKSGAAWVNSVKQEAANQGYDAAYSATAAQSAAPITSLSTGAGGALVATTVVEERVQEKGATHQPTASGAVSALSGLSGRQDRIVSRIAHQLLFYVPSADASSTGADQAVQRIQLLGYTSEMVGASN